MKRTLIHGELSVRQPDFPCESEPDSCRAGLELSTLGHPVADFAFHAMMYRLPPFLITGVMVWTWKLSTFHRGGLCAGICRRTGRSSIPNYDFYIIFNMFRWRPFSTASKPALHAALRHPTCEANGRICRTTGDACLATGL